MSILGLVILFFVGVTIIAFILTYINSWSPVIFKEVARRAFFFAVNYEVDSLLELKDKKRKCWMTMRIHQPLDPDRELSVSLLESHYLSMNPCYREEVSIGTGFEKYVNDGRVYYQVDSIPLKKSKPDDDLETIIADKLKSIWDSVNEDVGKKSYVRFRGRRMKGTYIADVIWEEKMKRWKK